MSLGMAPETDPDVESSELQLAAAYGIEGLQRCRDSKEYDQWLDLFDVVLEELEKPLNRRQGSFPVKELAFPDEEKRAEVIQGFQEVSDIANAVKEENLEDRDAMVDDLSEAIDLAEDLLIELEEISE